MGARSHARLLEHNILNEGIGLPGHCEIVRVDTRVTEPGSYFCDASQGALHLVLAPSTEASSGSTFIFSKTDSTNHQVIIDAAETGGIEGISTVELLLRFECLHLQWFQSALHLI